MLLNLHPAQVITSSTSLKTSPLVTKGKAAGPKIHGNLPQVTENNGEPSRARTCDPLIKSQLLYQLSYRPTAEENYTFVN